MRQVSASVAVLEGLAGLVVLPPPDVGLPLPLPHVEEAAAGELSVQRAEGRA